MEYLSWRSERNQRLRESIFRIETRRLFGGRAVHAGSAREHHASRRHSADEHLQQALSCAARPISVEISADDPRGDGAAAEWAPFHIYKMSSWSRAMLMPLAIINHFKPTRDLPGEKQLHELYPLGTEQRIYVAPQRTVFGPGGISFCESKMFSNFCSRLIRPLRRRALEKAERWMVERIGEGSDGLAAVYPAMLNSFDRVARARLLENEIRFTKRRRKILPDFLSMIRRIFASNRVCRQCGTPRSKSSRWRNPGCPGASRAAKGRRMADQQGSADPRGLGGKQFASGSQRMGIRV